MPLDTPLRDRSSEGAMHAAFREALGSDATGSAAEAAFIDQALDDCEAGELPEVAPEDMGRWLADFWWNTARREVEGPQILLLPAKAADGSELPRDLLSIVQDDGPFLVGSIMGELADRGLSVRALFHPVVNVVRDAGGVRRADGEGEVRAESMILIVLDRVGEDQRQPLLDGIAATLDDTAAAVTDFPAMADLLRRTTAELEAGGVRGNPEAFQEELAFLRWLDSDNFVFLGARVYEYPRTPDGGYAAEEPLIHAEGSLGVLRDEDRSVLRRASEPAILTRQMRRRMEDESPLAVAKANLRSRVHRRAYMDYVGIKRYGADGKPSGEVRFVGLFTAEAYVQPVQDVPLIRWKAAHVLSRSGVDPDGHNGKRLRNVIDTYPRDELFQIDETELLPIATGIVHLYDRPRVRLFARRDPFDRFVSVLLFVPRDRYDSRVRSAAGALLAEAYGGRVSAYYPSFGDLPLARVHFVIGVTPGDHAEPELRPLEERITEIARTWEDRFEAAVRAGGAPSGTVAETLARYAGAFSPSYQAVFNAEEALIDLRIIDAMTPGETVRVRAYRCEADSSTCFRFKLYHPDTAARLSDVLPILEAMALKATVEDGAPVTRTLPDGSRRVTWVHEFTLDDPHGGDLVFEAVKQPFEDAFTAVWTGRTENDGFNRLVLELGVSWREAALVRTLARYRQQTGLDPAQGVQEEALAQHPEVTRLILGMFTAKFDPLLGLSVAEREEKAAAIRAEAIEALQAVPSLDHDRVLRRLVLLVDAAKRTNFFQPDADGTPKPYISVKFASRELDDLPQPKPFREIFVWAPHVEGVHLRFGPVARGGLRWSDRASDFRTEVLGLVKAQQVKNAVIVPVGAKGGFYPKALPRGGTPAETREAAIVAYRTFLSGLLDITDNLDATGAVVRPPQVISYEPDDPYLVVAADKGTATFSDIANGISADYGFWLGDAFASGGSVGYDHKVMGITARGAWEAVKRHFRELGKDIQAEPFTVMGVGDMSGDVFGNGMLLSKQTRLLAAFDHRDIFLDPDPDAAVSFAERKRLFDLPRSSWQDYDASKISAGGGVFSRALKSIPLSAEVRKLLGVTEEAMAPTDLMRAILKAPAELLYLGGIGTYVKAADESHADAGDKANDAVRVDGRELRVQVVGEGANLGLTQQGRIEFAQLGAGGAGGRINTDAIDNSAGVDSSDHEVNIKILTGAALRSGALAPEDRNALLASMTDDVAAHVLEHNVDQTLALTLLEAEAPATLADHERFMLRLEAEGRLLRAVEGLPDAAEIAERAAASQGLTRPELAVLMAYGKLELNDDIVDSRAPDDPAFFETLESYFPAALRSFDDEMKGHRLRREIVATVLANRIVNVTGPDFAQRLRAGTGADTTAMVVAYEAARRVFRLDESWDAVAALDGQIPAAAQTALYQEIAMVQRRQTFWLARRAATTGAPSVGALVRAYREAADELRRHGARLLSPFEREVARERYGAFIDLGAPRSLAAEVAGLRPLTATSDVADLARSRDWPVLATARLYQQVGAALNLDRLRTAASETAGADPYERLAVRRLIEDLLAQQIALTDSVMRFAAVPEAGETAETARETFASWAALRYDVVTASQRTLEEIEASGGWTFAKLTIANAAVRTLTAAA